MGELPEKVKMPGTKKPAKGKQKFVDTKPQANTLVHEAKSFRHFIKENKVVTIHHHPDYDEYRVPNPGEKGKGAGYFTNDKKDAEDTARSIHGKDIVIKHRSKRYVTEAHTPAQAGAKRTVHAGQETFHRVAANAYERRALESMGTPDEDKFNKMSDQHNRRADRHAKAWEIAMKLSSRLREERLDEIKAKSWAISPTGQEVYVHKISGDRAHIQHTDGSKSEVSLKLLKHSKRMKEPLDEISKQLLARYTHRSAHDMAQQMYNVGRNPNGNDAARNRAIRRMSGLNKAARKIGGKKWNEHPRQWMEEFIDERIQHVVLVRPKSGEKNKQGGSWHVFDGYEHVSAADNVVKRLNRVGHIAKSVPVHEYPKHLGENDVSNPDNVPHIHEGRGRPRKDGSGAEEESKHIVVQLHKVLSLGGKKPVEFESGERVHIHPHEAHRALNRYSTLQKPAEKESWMKRASSGLKSFRASIAEKKD